MKYRYLEHTADIKIESYGKCMDEAFLNFALGVCNILYDIKSIEPKETREIIIRGKNHMRLLYEFIEEIIFLLETESFFISEIRKLKIEKDKLTAELIGEVKKNVELKTEIKSMTYHEMEIIEEGNKTIIRGVVDI